MSKNAFYGRYFGTKFQWKMAMENSNGNMTQRNGVKAMTVGSISISKDEELSISSSLGVG